MGVHFPCHSSKLMNEQPADTVWMFDMYTHFVYANHVNMLIVYLFQSYY